MTPAFKEHPQFCERVLQHTESLRNEPDLLEALASALKEHGIPLPAGVAAIAASAAPSVHTSPGTPAVAAGAPSGVGTAGPAAVAEQTKALPAASVVAGATADTVPFPPPGLSRRKTEPVQGGSDPSATAAAGNGENEVSTPQAELFLQAQERKAAAKALWQQVRSPSAFLALASSLHT
jgi:hypothetical protein